MPKERILIFPFDLLSHYLRCIVLAEQYKDYEIMFAYSEKYDAFVKKAGYKSFRVEKFDSEEVMRQAVEFKFDWLNYKDLERVLLSQIEAIEKFKPYLVISDTSPTLKMAAEITKTKHIALMNAYMSKYYAGVRHVSRAHYSYKYLKKLPPLPAKIITQFAERIAFTQVHKPFKQLRKKYSLSAQKFYLDELEGDENLVCDLEELFPLKKQPYTYKIIGPLIYKQINEENELIRSLNAGKKNICVCFGSSGNWSSLTFLSHEKYNKVNIIVAGDTDRHLNGPHIFHRDFINLDKVLPVCSFLICHGGNGTLYEALRNKTYMLFFTSHFEQEWNAARLVELGYGTYIHDDAESSLSSEIEKLINETSQIDTVVNEPGSLCT